MPVYRSLLSLRILISCDVLEVDCIVFGLFTLGGIWLRRDLLLVAFLLRFRAVISRRFGKRWPRALSQGAGPDKGRKNITVLVMPISIRISTGMRPIIGNLDNVPPPPGATSTCNWSDFVFGWALDLHRQFHIVWTNNSPVLDTHYGRRLCFVLKIPIGTEREAKSSAS